MPYRSFADYLGLVFGQAGRAAVQGLIAVFLVLLLHEPLHEHVFGPPAGAEAVQGRQAMPPLEAGVALALILCALVANRFVGRVCASFGEMFAARSGRLRLAVEDDRFRALEAAVRAAMVCGFLAVAAVTEAALLFAVEIGTAIVLVVPVGLGLPVLFVVAGVLLSEMSNEDMSEAKTTVPERRRLRPAAAVGGDRYGGDGPGA